MPELKVTAIILRMNIFWFACPLPLHNAKIIRTASRMANAFKGTFTALFVETSDFPTMSEGG